MKQLTTILLIIHLSTMVAGQQNKIDIGFEGGPGITFLRGNEILSTYNKLKIDFSCGIFFQYNFPKTFSIRTNITFERKGSSWSFSTTDLNGNLTVIKGHSNLDYLTVPVLFRLTFGKKITYYFNAGIFMGYLISQKYIYHNIGFLPSDHTSEYRSFDMGISGGIGFAIPVRNKFAISCELRNNLGLLNIAKGAVYNDGSIKTNSTNLLIGITYKIGMRQK